MKTKKSKPALSSQRYSPKEALTKTKASKVSSQVRAVSSQPPGWRQDVRKVLENSERQLNVIGQKINSMTKRMEVKTIRELKTFEKRWGVTQHWLKDRLELLRDLEQKAEGLIDTSKVQAHLAKLDTQDKIAAYKSRYDKLKLKLESLRKKTTEETTQALDSLSTACSELKKKLESTHSVTKD